MASSSATATQRDVTAVAGAKGASEEALWIKVLRQWGTIAVIVLTAIGFSLASPYFLTVSNLNNILFSMIVSCLVSVGLTFVVVGGSFDLSVGLTVTTCSIVTAFMIPIVGPGALSSLRSIVACAIGLVNGLLVTYGRLSGIVVTLGTMFVLGGINIAMTGGYQVAVDYKELAFRYIGQGKVGMIAFPVLLLLAIAADHAALFNPDEDGPLHRSRRRQPDGGVLFRYQGL